MQTFLEIERLLAIETVISRHPIIEPNMGRSTVSGVWIPPETVATMLLRATKFAKRKRRSGVVRFEKRGGRAGTRRFSFF
jgi:hypothetical protein